MKLVTSLINTAYHREMLHLLRIQNAKDPFYCPAGQMIEDFHNFTYPWLNNA